MARRRTTRLDFGKAEQLPSGRWRARYTWPPTHKPRYNHKAPHTFEARRDAEAWLAAEERAVELDRWTPPADRQAAEKAASLTVTELIDQWLSLPTYKESTRQSHRRKLDNRVLAPSRPGFDSLADVPVSEVDRQRIVKWWGQVQATWPDTGSTNADAYKRLRTAFEYALHELEVISVNPVKVKGAGRAPRPLTRNRPVISMPEAHAIVQHAPDRLTAPVMLLLWTGLRIGELLELRRRDLDGLVGTGAVTVKVRRNAQRIKDPATGKQVMLTLDRPKTDAGNRDLVLPATVAAEVRRHAEDHMAPGPDAFVVTTTRGPRMLSTTFLNRWNPIALAAGRPDITPHDCRRFYGTLLVNSGVVSLEEARRLMGHETIDQLMEYQRASAGYERRAAKAIDDLLLKPDDNSDRH